MAELRVTELEFETIKEDLKNFLRGQAEFQDYDFDGAGLSILLDVLAYNTHYNATLTHMMANEMFIDSAVKRNSVVSIAKTLGYTPRSRRSSRARINMVVRPATSYLPNSLLLSKDTVFTASGLNRAYTFYPVQDYTAFRTNTNGTSEFQFGDIVLIEGRRATNTFIIDQSTLSGPLVLPNDNIDTNTIRVRVQESLSTSDITTYQFSSSLIGLDADSDVFFLEEGPSGLYEIRFGDDVVGRKLSPGNVVIVDYIVSSGSLSNYIGTTTASSYSCSQVLTGSTETKNITVLSAASGGLEKESIDEIRFNAPKFNSTRNRVVTIDDYRTLIISQYGNAINSIAVWGGEENVPPIYGKVFISLEPITGTVLTQNDYDVITRDIIKPRSVVSIQPEYVDPEYTYINLDVTVKYNSTVTTFTPARIEQEVNTVITSFFENNLNKLEKNFYYSRLNKSVLETTSSIYSTNIEVQMYKVPAVVTGVASNFTISYNIPLREESIRSTNIKTTLGGVQYDAYLTDDSNGGIIIKNVSDDATIGTSVGSVDYSTGTITINSLTIDSYVGNILEFRIYAKPESSSPDIIVGNLRRISDVSTSAVFAYASRNTVLKLDTSGSDSASGTPNGLTITAIPSVQE